MGKCLSCCDPDDEPTQNGLPTTSTVIKPTPSSTGCTSDIIAQRYGGQTSPLIGSGDCGPSKPSAGNETMKMLDTPNPNLTAIRKANCGQSKQSLVFSSQNFTECGISDLFDKYKDSYEDAIIADGIEKLCIDLQVRPEEFKVLVLAWKFNAATMCCFTREEFTNGCRKLSVDSIQGIREKFSDILLEVRSQEKFRDLYRWTYRFGQDTDASRRTLPLDMAISLWGLVFSQNEPPILKRWLNFLEMHPSIKGISKDTWDMFINFCDVVGDDLSCYDNAEAWPSLLDDFVEYENDRENQNLQTKEHTDDYYLKTIHTLKSGYY